MSKKLRVQKFHSPIKLMNDMKSMYLNKYYNIFMNLGEWGGDITDIQQEYLMRQLWSEGSLAGYKIKFADELGLAPFVPFEWDMYDYPSKVNLINKRGVSRSLIPSKTMVVDKDVVLLYAQFNKKPVRAIVDYYVDRMVQVDMVINTNIELHKLPFLIGCDSSDKDSLQDVIDRILNNEIVVFTDLEAVNLIKALQTAPQYIVDKLHAYRIQMENELLSFLGIDNSGNQEKATTMLLDEINANNVFINLSAEQFKVNIEKWCKKMKDILGINITFKLRAEPAEETAESRNRSDANIKNDFNRQGEREGEENE